jgi:hypothetical protein
LNRQLVKRALYTLLPTCGITMGVMVAFIACTGNLVTMAHGSATLQSQKQRFFSVSTHTHPTLIINASAGLIRVNIGQSGHIVVNYTIHHDGSGRPPKVTFSQNINNNSVTITEKEYPQPNYHANQHTDFMITVPRNTDLDFSTGAGTIDVSGVSSRFQLRTHAGDVVTHNVFAKGQSLLLTSAGQIKFSGSVQPGSVCNLHTNAGELDAYLPGSAHVYVSASLNAGIISSDFSSISVGRNSASGYIGSGPYGQLLMDTSAGIIGIHHQ